MGSKVKRGAKGRTHLRRRNPIARALIERAHGGRVIPSRKRYTRKAKHAKPVDPERDR